MDDPATAQTIVEPCWLGRIPPEDIPVVGGLIHISEYGVVQITPHEGRTRITLGRFDVAEILRKISGTDDIALESIAINMRMGHRFTSEDFDPRNAELEPF